MKGSETMLEASERKYQKVVEGVNENAKVVEGDGSLWRWNLYYLLPKIEYCIMYERIID